MFNRSTERSQCEHRQRGITFLESLVTVAIIGIGFTGLLALSAANIRAAESSTNSFVASNLAIEGVEIVRRMRDSNWLQDNDWLENFSFADSSVQYNETTFGAKHNDFIKIDANGVYQYDTGTDTKFKRTVNLQDLGNDDLRVLVTVTWPERGSQQSIVVEDILYDWK